MAMEWTDLLETDSKYEGRQKESNINVRYLNDFLGSVNWEALSQLEGIAKVYESNRQVYEKNRHLWDAQIKELFDKNDELVRANEKQNISLESLTGDWTNQLSDLQTNYTTQLEAAELGWDKEKASLIEQMAADAAGWESRVKAWDQQSADWTTSFAQQQLKHETDLATALQKQEQNYLQEMATRGEQTQAELDAWQKTAADERAEFAKQLEASGIENTKQLEELKKSFAQQQEAQRLQGIEERGHLESQLQDFYTEQWSQQQQDLTSQYTEMINQATTDAEVARLEQAQQFEQMQLDQSAAWADQAQQIYDRERVFDSRLDEIKNDLGIQEGLYAGVSQRIEDQQSFNKAERQALEQQLGFLGETSAAEREALGQQFGQQLETQADEAAVARENLGEELSEEFAGNLQTATEDWSSSLTDVSEQFGQQLSNEQTQRELLADAVRRNRELGIQNAERARISAAYGRQGSPMNQEVQGVRTLNERTPDANMYRNATGAFNRQGLRIKNLNI